MGDRSPRPPLVDATDLCGVLSIDPKVIAHLICTFINISFHFFVERKSSLKEYLGNHAKYSHHCITFYHMTTYSEPSKEMLANTDGRNQLMCAEATKWS